ncbi:MAG: SCO family protein [Terrimicrobiaceae bacterium]|nr:SCO family protein [Terrimicrobiaceae bacterium]
MGRTGRIPRLGRVIAFLGFAVLCALAYSGLKGTRPAPIPAHLKPISQAPDFQLLDQAGKPFGLADLKGKIWVASFLSTRCKGPCPVISSRMAELNKMVTRTGGGVELVSFSVDPDFDQPDVLAAYSNKLGADPARWKFLTGRQEGIDAVVGRLQPLATEPDGTPAHLTRIVLVDRDGRLRGVQEGTDPEAVQKLLMDIGDLLREDSSGKP